VRTCSEGKLGAIKLAIDRVDGKVITPIKFEFPKVYITFPNATTKAELPAGSIAPEESSVVVSDEPAEPEEDTSNIATMSLKQTLEKMADSPRVVTSVILDRKRRVESCLANGDELDDNENTPLVKSVIAANLLHLAENHNFEAIVEVFDRIDGKLVETISVIGEDMYISSYITEAPAGAVKNKDGIYQIEAREVENIWYEKLKSKVS